MTDLKKDFMKEVEAAAKSRYAVDVFADMVRAMALALESPLQLGARHKAIEDEYEQIRARYTRDEFSHFPRAFAIVMDALDRCREDFLGHALEHLGAANTRNGQFLTPVSVSRMMARLNCAWPPDGYKPGQIVKMNDPACGSSVLLIEGCEALRAAGVRGDDILVDAGDIDGRACDISYVQLSLLGYPAVVRHMEALAMRVISPDRFTMGYFIHGMPMRLMARRPAAEGAPAPAEECRGSCEQGMLPGFDGRAG